MLTTNTLPRGWHDSWCLSCFGKEVRGHGGLSNLPLREVHNTTEVFYFVDSTHVSRTSYKQVEQGRGRLGEVY